MLRSTIPSTVEIRQHMQDPLPTLYADPTQIQQIVMNLCTNAAQAMEAEGGILEVTADSIDVAAGTAITTARSLRALTSGSR